jgi:hypothetical protein
VCKGFFNGLFVDGRRTFGEACEAGRVNVYNMYNNSGEYRGFTTLGDPEMNIWTAIPKPLEVIHDSLLLVGEEWLPVTVRSQTAPVESALVCVVLDTVVYEYGYTTNEGEIVLNLETLIPGYMHITVTAKNKIPYIDSILVVSTQVEEIEELTTAAANDITIHPNPFTNYTDIRYQITDNRQKYALQIFDITGRLVSDLSKQTSVIGHQISVRWDGCDNMGNRLPAGVYFVQGLTTEETLTVPVLLVR